MKKRTWIIGGLLVIALAGIGVATRTAWSPWSPERAAAQASRGQTPQRVVPVSVGLAERKPVGVRVEALGTVTPIASVAIKARLETTITGVHFTDGAHVKAGDLLFTLDARQLEAQLAQAEGMLARDRAQLEGAERDVRRYTELVERRATPTVNLDNARTQADTFRAAIKADQAAVENLRVQLSFTKIHAPISGRISQAAVKVGNFVRPADTAPLATINQMVPVYVSFSVPQKLLPEVRQALTAGTTRVEAFVPGEPEPALGKLTMIENTVDPTTGMVILRATMDNKDELLWPGTLVNTQLILRIEESVVVPGVAVQSGQAGTYVFVVQDGAAVVRPVTVARRMDDIAVIEKGLEGGETVVLDGQLLLTNGTKVTVREPKAGS